ncbi:Hypothetical protein PAU_02585 [Photorhabdus asymbiotica]|uniref:Uncharacterized protein n=2 Tax=Photorhabdus asymbiotica TaxID=291112 RepID=C7BN78_PHOAA|nr:hypothetical protein BDD30_3599 [Photorhabdus asymbiotica]CAQ84677.1 Hypothetical protein PAU_02585 [Photorhabdus asymbiotica]
MVIHFIFQVAALLAAARNLLDILPVTSISWIMDKPLIKSLAINQQNDNQQKKVGKIPYVIPDKMTFMYAPLTGAYIRIPYSTEQASALGI